MSGFSHSNSNEPLISLLRYANGELSDMHLLYELLRPMDELLNEFIGNASQADINHNTVYLRVCIEIFEIIVFSE